MRPDEEYDAVDAVVLAMWWDEMSRDPDLGFVWALRLVDVERLANVYMRGPRAPLAAALAALRDRGWEGVADRLEEALAHRHAQAAAQTIANTRARRG